MDNELQTLLEKWTTAFQETTWYLTIFPEFQTFRKAHESITRTEKDVVYRFIEENLTKKLIPLAVTGPNWDAERQPINTVVIHHTSQPPGITAQRLSAIHLLTLYAGHYASSQAETQIMGTSPYSGHWRGSEQVFYAYHWLIRGDGTRERLLEDQETGWQAGNWEVNCRSIGICFDADLTDVVPTPAALATARELITTYKISPERVLGHKEVNKSTSCPGTLFDTWRKELLQ